MKRENSFDRRATERARAVTRAKVRKQNIILSATAIALTLIVAASILTVGAFSAHNHAATAALPASTATVSSVDSAAVKTTAAVKNTQTAQSTTAQTETVQYTEDSATYTQPSYVQDNDTQNASQDAQQGEDRIDVINGDRVYIDTKRTAPEITGTPAHFYAYGKTSYGFDWTYSADNCNFTLACNYDFNQQQYDFIFYGAAPGTANVTVCYNTDDNVQVPVDLTVTVDDALNVSVY